MNWSLLPPVCLTFGLVGGFSLGEKPFLAARKATVAKIGKTALQLSVVLLGFGIPLGDVWRAGKSGFLLAALTILGTFGLAFVASRLLRTPPRLATLVAAGTAICGGSAIAALAPVVEADADETAASLATVFLLNAVALFLFPILGHAAGLPIEAFAEWAALAIHDTSSVVGAALAYNPSAVPMAATVKLSRALWIAPVCVVGAAIMRRVAERAGGSKERKGNKTPWLPWFVPGFLAASLVRSYLPAPPIYEILGAAAKLGLAFSLLCIGLGVNRKVLVKAGARALALGLTLWVIVSVSTFLVVTG